MARLLLLATTLLSAGCGSSEVWVPPEPPPEEPPPPVAPYVTGVKFIYCIFSERSGDVYSLKIEVTDPDGIDTVAGGTWRLLLEEEPLFEAEVACRDGLCYASGRETSGAPGCDVSESIVHEVLLVDDDGNLSEPFLQEGSDLP